jgi:hypothetical protein
MTTIASDRKQLTFIIRAHGTAIERMFNVPRGINLYHITNYDDLVSGSNSVYEALYDALEYNASWPDANKCISSVLKDAYDKNGNNRDDIVIKHIKGNDSPDNTSVTHMSSKSGSFSQYRQDYSLTITPIIYEAPAGLIHVPSEWNSRRRTEYTNGTFLLSEIVQSTRDKYRDYDVHIICMFCRRLESKLLEPLARQISSTVVYEGRQSTLDKEHILDVSSSVHRKVAKPKVGDLVYYKVPTSSASPYQSGRIFDIEDDILMVQTDENKEVNIERKHLVSEDDWRAHQRGGGLWRPFSRSPTGTGGRDTTHLRSYRNRSPSRRSPSNRSPRRWTHRSNGSFAHGAASHRL